jgi:hypothetical protein
MYCVVAAYVYQNKTRRSGFWEFSVYWYSYLSEPIKRPMRMNCRLQLLVLLELRSSPVVLSTLLLFALSKP